MPKMSLSGKNNENLEIFLYTFQRIETLKNFPQKNRVTHFNAWAM